MTSIDRAQIERHLGEQLGFITREQLGGCEVTPMRLLRAVERGELRRQYPGIYCRGNAILHPHQEFHAACLWLPGAVVSHTAAAAAYELWGIENAKVEISAKTKRTRTPKGVVLHRARDLLPEDIRVVDGIRFTSPVRTIIDLASWLDEENLAFALDCAWKADLLTPEKVRARLLQLRDSGMEGVSMLLRLLDDCDARGCAADSPLEVRFWRKGRDAGLLPFEFQRWFHDEEGNAWMDFVWEKEKFSVETRGYFWHGLTKSDFEYNANRTSRITARGYSVMPVTWDMLEEDPDRVMRLVKEALKARGRVFPR